MEPEQRQRFILNSLFGLTILLWVCAFVKYFLPATLPFWIGLAVAYLLKPVTLWLCRLLKFRRKNAAFSVMLLFYLLAGSLLWWGLLLLSPQLGDLLEHLPGFYSDSVQPLLHQCALKVNGMLDDFSPRTAKLLVEKSAEFSSSLSSELAGLSAKVLSSATDMAKKIPFWLTTVAFSVLCSVFISMDYSAVMAFILRQFPEKLRPLLFRCKKFLSDSLFHLLRAYLILLVITFAQLLAGFYLLRIEQPLLWATVLALLDFLPFIGTGLVLIPWGLYHLLGGKTALGAGLLILYAILTVVHNLLEPKLVSSSIGLHPLATLVAMYAGLRFLGFGGLVAAPLLLLLLCYLQKEGCFRFYK